MQLSLDKTYSYSDLAQSSGVKLPTPKTEAWKYTRLRDLLAVKYQPCPQIDNVGTHIDIDAYVVNISNGYVVSELPQVDGVSFSLIHETNEVTEHPFVVMNAHYLSQGLIIKILGNVNKPILLNYFIKPENNNYFYNFRNKIICAENSSATFIEQYSYEGDVKSSYFANIVNEINIQKNATFCHYKYQNESFKSNHIALHKVDIADKGKYESFCLTKGANLSRNETEVNLNGEWADAIVNAAYIMNGWATLDTTTNIYHNQPNTSSSQLVKGVIGGTARGIFQGKIHIAPNAIKTTGNQLHKAMLLTDTAEIDVKPELEIFADDVKCSHGAASGELDKEQIFYMCSRGIGEEEAKKLLIDAYITDVISQLTNETVRELFKGLI